jgi:hypothetical protein
MCQHSSFRIVASGELWHVLLKPGLSRLAIAQQVADHARPNYRRLRDVEQAATFATSDPAKAGDNVVVMRAGLAWINQPGARNRAVEVPTDPG